MFSLRNTPHDSSNLLVTFIPPKMIFPRMNCLYTQQRHSLLSLNFASMSKLFDPKLHGERLAGALKLTKLHCSGLQEPATAYNGQLQPQPETVRPTPRSVTIDSPSSVTVPDATISNRFVSWLKERK